MSAPAETQLSEAQIQAFEKLTAPQFDILLARFLDEKAALRRWRISQIFATIMRLFARFGVSLVLPGMIGDVFFVTSVGLISVPPMEIMFAADA